MVHNEVLSRHILRKRPDLSPTEKLVAITILSYRNPETEECFPNQVRVAVDTGLSREQINRTVKKLREKSVVSIKKEKLPSSRRLVRNYLFLNGNVNYSV